MCGAVFVCVNMCMHTSLCSSSDQEKPPPLLAVQVRLPSSPPSIAGGLRDTDTPPQKKTIPDPESPSPGCPSHSPIWILLGKLAPTTAPRKPVQKKAKMCCIFLFALAKKKPRSSHRFGISPPSLDSSLCSAFSFPPAVPAFLACFLLSFWEVWLCFPWNPST